MTSVRSRTVYVWACILVGTFARVQPLFDPDGRALRQFASEDGYLMLTIARNLAIGNGLSIEAGNTVTNGTQPLMTFLYGGAFWLVGGDKTWGVVLVQLIGVGVAVLAALLLHRVAAKVLQMGQYGGTLAAIIAATWYASPLGTRFTQNCLETGAATLVPMAVGLYLLNHRLSFDDTWRIRDCVVLGCLLGLAFWIRNDAVLLSVAVCCALALSGLCGPVPFGRRIVEAACAGTTALFVVAPWLIFNYSLFGNIVPVSGISQGADGLAESVLRVPAILAEQLSVVALVPVSWETHPVVVLATSAAVLGWVALVYRETRAASRAQRQWLALLGAWASLHVGFYGLIYGAGYFMGRYLFPLSTWAALFSIWLGYQLWVRADSRRPRRPGRPRRMRALSLGLILALIVGLDVRMYLGGMNNGHFQVIEWVDEHVPENVWVAAIQTGTLGFFHDKTFNLDGKVSPPALAAKLEGHTFDYVLERPIQYLVDWVGIAKWLDDPDLGPHFEVVLLDEEKNLAVLRRRDQ